MEHAMLVLYAAMFVQMQLGQFQHGLDVGGREAPLIPLSIQKSEIEPREPWLAHNFSAAIGGLLSLFIHKGMTAEEVIQILGRPDSFYLSFNSSHDSYR